MMFKSWFKKKLKPIRPPECEHDFNEWKEWGEGYQRSTCENCKITTSRSVT